MNKIIKNLLRDLIDSLLVFLAFAIDFHLFVIGIGLIAFSMDLLLMLSSFSTEAVSLKIAALKVVFGREEIKQVIELFYIGSLFLYLYFTGKISFFKSQIGK